MNRLNDSHRPPRSPACRRGGRLAGTAGLWILALIAGPAQAASTATAPAAAASAAQADVAEFQRLLKAGQHAQALKLTTDALAKTPDHPQWLFRRGVALAMMERKTEALAVFQKLVSEHPEMPAPYNNLAVLHGSMGDYDKARMALERAIQTHPAYATAYQNLGDVYAQLASQAYNKALLLDRSGNHTQPKLALLSELSTPTTSAAAGAGAASAASTRPTANTGAPASRPRESLPLASMPSGASAAATNTPSAGRPALLPPVARLDNRSTGTSGAGAGAVAAGSATTPTAAASAVAAKLPAKAASAPATVAAAKPAPPAAVAATSTPAARPAGAVPTPDATATAEVETAVRAWAAAWSRRDMPAYLGAYTADFSGSAGSRKAWEKERQDRIAGRKQIRVDLKDLKVTVKGNQAQARFRQAYVSDALTTNSRKTLELIRSNSGKWVIRQELTGG